MTSPQDRTTWNLCSLCAARGRSKRIDTGHLCTECAVGLQRRLNQIIRLVDGAPDFVELTRGAGSVGRPAYTSKAPLNVEALDPERIDVPRWRSDDINPRITPPTPDPQPLTLLDTLASWDNLIREIRGMEGIAAVTLTGVVGSLNRSVGWLVNQAAFPIEDFSECITDCLRVAKRWETAGRTNLWDVDCPADLGGKLCGYRLQVKADDIDGDVRCKRCRTTWPVERLMRVAASPNAGHIWLDAEAMCKRLGVDKKTLHRWVRESRIAKSHGLYDAAPLLRPTDTTVGA